MITAAAARMAASAAYLAAFLSPFGLASARAGNGVRKIIVETASRFARDLMVAEVGFKMLRDRGIDLIAADNPTTFLDDGPTSILIRQILGAVAQFEKAMLVAKRAISGLSQFSSFQGDLAAPREGGKIPPFRC